MRTIGTFREWNDDWIHFFVWKDVFRDNYVKFAIWTIHLWNWQIGKTSVICLFEFVIRKFNGNRHFTHFIDFIAYHCSSELEPSNEIILIWFCGYWTKLSPSNLKPNAIYFQLYEYGRSGNPTRDVLERCLASLDNGKFGLTFSSGLGVTTILTQLLSSGDHMISCDDVYGGTFRLFSKVISRQGISVDFVDATNLDHFKNAIKPNTRVS